VYGNLFGSVIFNFPTTKQMGVFGGFQVFSSLAFDKFALCEINLGRNVDEEGLAL
jgi:hypothetical protein